ncbi:hypothetical protein MAFF211271_21440 [Ralstonia syzygii subsp. indonesiensis]|nr:hypothetical protein CJO85_11010 [Ralstonia solanacearum]BEU72589.1 hypothetical protein MAFF211271_21440 [Ralstonia pseudosolanacearum]
MPQPDWTILWHRGQWITAGLPQSGWVPSGTLLAMDGLAVCQRRCAVIRGPAQLPSHRDDTGVLHVDASCAEPLLGADPNASPYRSLPPHSRAAKRLSWMEHFAALGAITDLPLTQAQRSARRRNVPLEVA